MRRSEFEPHLAGPWDWYVCTKSFEERKDKLLKSDLPSLAHSVKITLDAITRDKEVYKQDWKDYFVDISTRIELLEDRLFNLNSMVLRGWSEPDKFCSSKNENNH